jgi:uncharacterized membrane-anchored protein
LTKRLATRLGPGDIAVIEHPGLDPLSAQDLAASGAACVVNVARSTSARYPNLGPSVLVEAGVTLLDAPGAMLFDTLADGEELTVEDGCVLRDEVVVARGSVLDPAAVALALEAARGSLDSTIDDFVANTLAHLRADRGLLAGPLCLPDLRTAFGGRPALVVARGAGAGADLRALSDFVRRTEPAHVGVDGGADLIAAAGWRPDVIVGDMDSASDRALASGAELLVHAYRDGSAPGAARLRRLGLAHERLTVPGTSEDAALLLAADKGARPVVSVGSGIGLADFLDRGRAGMASTLLTRRLAHVRDRR